MNEPKESRKETVRHKRIPSDNYATPFSISKWAIDHVVKISEKHCGKPTRKLRMLEPGCGDNAPFSRYAASIGMEAHGVDYREVGRRETVAIIGDLDFLEMPSEKSKMLYANKYDVIATNPPFIYGIEFIQRSLDMLSPRGVAVFLVKMTFLGTQGRSDFFKERPPAEIHVLTQRPSFAYGGTDKGQEYCLLVWNGSDVDKKIRAKHGRVSRMFWQDNKNWETPVLPDGEGERIQVEKFDPEEPR